MIIQDEYYYSSFFLHQNIPAAHSFTRTIIPAAIDVPTSLRFAHRTNLNIEKHPEYTTDMQAEWRFYETSNESA